MDGAFGSGRPARSKVRPAARPRAILHPSRCPPRLISPCPLHAPSWSPDLRLRPHHLSPPLDPSRLFTHPGDLHRPRSNLGALLLPCAQSLRTSHPPLPWADISRVSRSGPRRDGVLLRSQTETTRPGGPRSERGRRWRRIPEDVRQRDRPSQITSRESPKPEEGERAGPRVSKSFLPSRPAPGTRPISSLRTIWRRPLLGHVTVEEQPLSCLDAVCENVPLGFPGLPIPNQRWVSLPL